MSLSYKARRRLSLVALTLGLPLYIVVAVTLTGWLDARFGRLPIWAELLVFVGLGFLWIVPLKPVFTGVGRPDPAADPATDPAPRAKPAPETETKGQGPSV